MVLHQRLWVVPQPISSVKGFYFCGPLSVIRQVFAREHESLNHLRHKGVNL